MTAKWFEDLLQGETETVLQLRYALVEWTMLVEKNGSIPGLP